MATIKSYTNIDQSKILAEILSPENADMCYPYNRHLNEMYGDIPYVMGYKKFNKDTDIPCWSLAALLDVLKDDIKIEKTLFDQSDIFTYSILGDAYEYRTYEHENLIDACVEMILTLKERNLI